MLQGYDDFKYVMQDTGCVYFGKELTYAEMMEREDVPFKFQAVISTHIAKDTDLDIKMADHILRMSAEEFSFRIYEQLKMSVKLYYKTQKKGFGGKNKERWIHKSVPLRTFHSTFREAVAAGTIKIEDISISKFALMTISI